MARKRRRNIDWSRIRWGSLTRWLLKHREKIMRRCGDPFTKSGEINDRVLRCLEKNPEFVKKLAGTHYKRILRKIRFKLYALKG